VTVEHCKKIKVKEGKEMEIKEKYLCVRIFKNDTVLITDEAGNPIAPMKEPRPLVGPESAYGHIIWSNQNPTCVYVFGRQY
jgi:hypothetical protein